MKAVVLNQIKRAVASLVDSTYLEVYGNGFKVVAKGLNSPYTSHQEIEYEWNGERDHVAILNGKHGLIVAEEEKGKFGSDWYIEPKLVMTEHGTEVPAWYWHREEWIGGDLVPAALLKPLWERLQFLGIELPEEPLVRVWVRSRIVSTFWGNQPVFELAGEVPVGEEVYCDDGLTIYRNPVEYILPMEKYLEDVETSIHSLGFPEPYGARGEYVFWFLQAGDNVSIDGYSLEEGRYVVKYDTRYRG